MIKKFIQLSLVGLLFIGLVSCTAVNGLKIFRDSDNGQTVGVKTGRIFRIELPANLTTGFSWSIMEMPAEYFQLVDSGYLASHPVMIGSGGQSWWLIRPLKTGNSRIYLKYFRRWEGPQKSARDFGLNYEISR